MADNNNGTTTVSTVDVADLDSILGSPTGESVMVPDQGGSKEVKKPNLFTSKPVDMTFLDKDDDDDDDAAGKAPAVSVPTPTASADDKGGNAGSDLDVDKDIDSLLSPDGSDKGGRPKMDKDAMLAFTKKLIEKNKIIPFDDDKPLEKYTLQDFEELFEANFEEKEKKLRQEIPLEFFDNLPEELQVAAKYVADGGADLRGLFRTLAQVEEVRQLDPSEETDQEQIVRSYLHATQFGTAEEIEEEITSWKDRDELGSKAKKFKPKLDAMQEQVVARQLAQQEQMRKQQAAQAQMYMDNVYKVLEPAEINGIKLDKKTQSLLYAGLVQPNYPSISGKSTNMLGHLLEKYQWVEPRHDLIAEALWLLADPEGYRSKVKEQGKKDAVEKTVRMLKTEEKNKISSTASDDYDEPSRQSSQQKISRPSQNFFKR
jgi:hypothetical protein